MKAVASSNEIALQFAFQVLLAKADDRPIGIEPGDAHIFDFEDDFAAGVQPRLDQILYHFLLSVDRNRAACEFPEVNSMAASVEEELEPFMHQSFSPHALADSRCVEQIHRSLFQHTGAYPMFHKLAALGFYYHGVNPIQVKQMRKHEPGRSSAYNTDLCSHSELVIRRFGSRFPQCASVLPTGRPPSNVAFSM